MVYMGSKRKYCKYIVPIIQKYIDEHNIVQFIDCFCGGANLADKINCKRVICNDLSPTLIALHKQAQEDFSKIPEEGIENIGTLLMQNGNKLKKKFLQIFQL